MSTLELRPVLPHDLPWLRAGVAAEIGVLEQAIRAARRRRRAEVEAAHHQEVVAEYRRLVRWNQGLVETQGRWSKRPSVLGAVGRGR